MKKNPPKPNKRKIRIPPSKRNMLWVIGAFIVLFGVLILQLVVRVLIEGPDNAAKAARQWTMNTSIRAQRGEIQDRNGTVLASSYTTYQVCANPRAISADDRERVAYILSTLLEVDYENTLKKITDQTKQQVKIKDQVEKSIINQLSAQQLGSGISYYSDVKRSYPEGNHFSQILGFTNVDGDGQSGVELDYNSYLAGINGHMVTQTDRDNQPIPNAKEEYVDAVAGANLILTADTGLQNIVEAIAELCGTVNNAKTVQIHLYNPQSGETYAMTSWPSYDPNNPPRSDAKTLLELARNRIVTDTYEPGSTFKIITLAAALDSGAITMNTRFSCSGSLLVKGQRIKCWKKGGHGDQSLAEAVQNSCNCAFMAMTLKMGKDTFYDYIYKFGLGTKTELGLSGETSGSVTHKKYIRDTDLARIGFGQSISMTGMQLSMAAAAAVNGGELLKPYLVAEIVNQSGEVLLQNYKTVIRRVISAETSALMRQLLQGVVDDGSGKNAAVPGYTVSGKTGTAQKYEEDGSVSSTRLIASFIGFAPATEPTLGCLIIVDEPQVPVVFGSTVAAPYVQMVLTRALAYMGIQPDSDTGSVLVPDLTGYTIADARKMLKDVGLGHVSLDEESGATVQRQSPAAKTRVVAGSDVILFTAWTSFLAEDEEIEYTQMPDIMDKTRLVALDRLQAAGLIMDYDPENCAGVVSSVEYEYHTSLPVGTVVRVEFTYTAPD